MGLSKIFGSRQRLSNASNHAIVPETSTSRNSFLPAHLATRTTSRTSNRSSTRSSVSSSTRSQQPMDSSSRRSSNATPISALLSSATSGGAMDAAAFIQMLENAANAKDETLTNTMWQLAAKLDQESDNSNSEPDSKQEDSGHEGDWA